MLPAVCKFTKKQTPTHIFSRTLLKLSKFLFYRASLWWLLLLLDKNSSYYERCITVNKLPNKTIFDFNQWLPFLREIDLHETSERTALIEKTLVVRGTSCIVSFYLLLVSFLIILSSNPPKIFLLFDIIWSCAMAIVIYLSKDPVKNDGLLQCCFDKHLATFLFFANVRSFFIKAGYLNNMTSFATIGIY